MCEIPKSWPNSTKDSGKQGLAIFWVGTRFRVSLSSEATSSWIQAKMSRPRPLRENIAGGKLGPTLAWLVSA
jgi:hypothetical protein